MSRIEEILHHLDDEEKILKERLKTTSDRIAELEKENAKLQEQLKNAVVPKYKYGEKKYIIEHGTICYGYIEVFDYYTNMYFIKIYPDWEEEPYCLSRLESKLFDTVAEALEYLRRIN